LELLLAVILLVIFILSFLFVGLNDAFLGGGDIKEWN
jgi:hypothetical protein